jgi:hypothetical protein
MHVTHGLAAAFLLRFLRARKWNIREAHELLKSMLAWRVERDMRNVHVKRLSVCLCARMCPCVCASVLVYVMLFSLSMGRRHSMHSDEYPLTLLRRRQRPVDDNDSLIL